MLSRLAVGSALLLCPVWKDWFKERRSLLRDEADPLIFLQESGFRELVGALDSL